MIPLYLLLCVCVCVLSHVQLFATPRTIARPTSLSMEFPRQEYRSGLPFPTPYNSYLFSITIQGLAQNSLVLNIIAYLKSQENQKQ